MSASLSNASSPTNSSTLFAKTSTGGSPSHLSHYKTTVAKLVSMAKEAAQVTLPCASPITSAALHGVNESSRTVITMNTVNIDRGELEAIFERKRSLWSKIRKQLKNIDLLQRAQEDSAIQNIVLESTLVPLRKRITSFMQRLLV
ncbi:hypothetical protein SLA2020_029380 [Shorea laevis]